MNVITESEKKRLQSLKEKEQAFKAKKQLIQQALRNLDNTTNNKKIIFDDDFCEQQQQSSNLKRKKTDLFDSDDNDEKDCLWNEDEFNANKKKKMTLGNDARFTLDDRFVEDNCQTEETEAIENSNECDLQKEKEKQLDILEGILGTPLIVKSQENKTTNICRKGLMIRYDPTENGHCEYEVKPTAQPKTKDKNAKKKKHDKSALEIEESALPEPEISKDIYYTVSDTLTESLKQKGEFSLLKTHGKKENDIENLKDHVTSTVENDIQRFKFNFNGNNAFKYDSSNDEDTHEIPDIDNQMIDEAKKDIHQNSLFGYKDTLFFDTDDVRFNEAVKFFSTSSTSNDQFNNLRRELKTIVRTKIRNNERKNQRKRKIKKFH
ncbi:nucleolar protein 8-like isoform X1 [Pogonomyrmex barbatus]|uniref:Nucleolar protein 8-like isoform X1 n=1 Tax=Pogonomyrmex barbatus TaxID=144034 RepID=A0A6I9WJS7_9HYME|nr:nucleolar protein 8-like isoform X1 [Pogonomyrmex barbatus]XP_011643060.1 nucleolar protein 8-like isoform X1 [Pogonomyrmex barbatus]